MRMMQVYPLVRLKGGRSCAVLLAPGRPSTLRSNDTVVVVAETEVCYCRNGRTTSSTCCAAVGRQTSSSDSGKLVACCMKRPWLKSAAALSCLQHSEKALKPHATRHATETTSQTWRQRQLPRRSSSAVNCELRPHISYRQAGGRRRGLPVPALGRDDAR